MSYLSQLDTTRQPRPVTGIRGATGLSRSALAAVIREIGLFGRDSGLDAADQVVVQKALGPLPGLPAPSDIRPRRQGRRSEVIQTLVRDAMLGAGRAGKGTRGAALQIGLTAPQITEIESVVGNAMDVFGLEASAEVEIAA